MKKKLNFIKPINIFKEISFCFFFFKWEIGRWKPNGDFNASGVADVRAC